MGGSDGPIRSDQSGSAAVKVAHPFPRIFSRIFSAYDPIDAAIKNLLKTTNLRYAIKISLVEN